MSLKEMLQIHGYVDSDEDDSKDSNSASDDEFDRKYGYLKPPPLSDEVLICKSVTVGKVNANKEVGKKLEKQLISNSKLQQADNNNDRRNQNNGIIINKKVNNQLNKSKIRIQNEEVTKKLEKPLVANPKLQQGNNDIRYMIQKNSISKVNAQLNKPTNGIQNKNIWPDGGTTNTGNSRSQRVATNFSFPTNAQVTQASFTPTGVANVTNTHTAVQRVPTETTSRLNEVPVSLPSQMQDQEPDVLCCGCTII